MNWEHCLNSVVLQIGTTKRSNLASTDQNERSANPVPENDIGL